MNQPEDWDDKEFIPDPEDKKPEVHFLHHIFNCFAVFLLLFLLIVVN